MNIQTLLLVSCNVMQIYFDHRSRAYRSKLIFPLPMLFFKGDNCSTHFSLNIGRFNFCGRPKGEPHVKKENILKPEACVTKQSITVVSITSMA